MYDVIFTTDLPRSGDKIVWVDGAERHPHTSSSTDRRPGRPGIRLRGLRPRSGVEMSTVYPDLPAAMIGHLRNTPRVVRDFAEDTSAAATTKFHADAAGTGSASPGPPTRSGRPTSST
jgi:hypothetical protein